jgi:hypothetical protein
LRAMARRKCGPSKKKRAFFAPGSVIKSAGGTNVAGHKEVSAGVGEIEKVYCPICTHMVDAELQHKDRHVLVKPGQKCPRCAGSLDAGYIFRADVFRGSRAA